MKERLKRALEDGLVLGVKYSIIAAVMLFLSFQFFQIRQGALQGAAAFDYLAKAQAKQEVPQDGKK